MGRWWVAGLVGEWMGGCVRVGEMGGWVGCRFGVGCVCGGRVGAVGERSSPPKNFAD